MPLSSAIPTGPTTRVRVGCELKLEASAPTPSVLQVQPHGEGARGLVLERLATSPAGPFREYRDLFGNRCQRFLLPAGETVLTYDAVVEVDAAPDPAALDAAEIPVGELPDDCLAFTLPSRYCVSDLLMDAAWERWGDHEPGWQRVQSICDWVHENITFQYGSSNPRTTALDVYQSRIGVCRDFTQLAVSFCRALNIPARYVFGYLPDIGIEVHDPMDFAAWFEAYLGGRWWTFDPRNNVPRIGRAVVGKGRDALDVSMLTTYGQVPLKGFRVWADQVGIDDTLEHPPSSTP